MCFEKPNTPDLYIVCRLHISLLFCAIHAHNLIWHWLGFIPVFDANT